jgi:hypothetical protein
MATRSRVLFGVVLLVGVAGTGFSVWLANLAGYSTLGSIIWVVGYGTTIFLLWFGWFREMEITGQNDPAEVAEVTTSDDGDATDP